jgi:hypothetical protein
MTVIDAIDVVASAERCLDNALGGNSGRDLAEEVLCVLIIGGLHIADRKRAVETIASAMYQDIRTVRWAIGRVIASGTVTPRRPQRGARRLQQVSRRGAAALRRAS